MAPPAGPPLEPPSPRRARRVALAAGAGILGLAALVRVTALSVLERHGGDPDDLLRSSPLGARAATPRAWTLVDGRHWQLTSDAGEAPADTDAREGTGGPCPAGMVHVEGQMLLDRDGAASSLGIELLQDDACTSWISRDFPARCAAFDRARWLRASAGLPRRPMRFCVDRFEYPGVAGAYPLVVVAFREAEALCAARGARLCTEAEWTFACEGDEGRPFPYGYTREPDACVVDRAWRAWDEAAFGDRASDRARREVDRLWQGDPSGSHRRCRSPFGVYDMTGNVDEWTRSVRKDGYASILKGGYWGPIRGRCRPSTRAHAEGFVAYQQGLRCCADVPATDEAPPPEADAGAPPREPPSEPSERELDELNAAAPRLPAPPALGCARAP